MGEATTNPIKKERFNDLTCLQQAVCILERLDKGMTIEQIIASCGGDGQLVSIWIDFITCMSWLERSKSATVLNAEKTFRITEEGRRAVEKYGEASGGRERGLRAPVRPAWG